MGGVVEQSVVDRVEDVDKEKKKSRRRSNRRSKHNSVSSSLNEVHGEGSVLSGNGIVSNHTATSLNYSSTPQESDRHPSNEHEVARASNVAFHSMPAMHINEQEDMADMQNVENGHLFPSEKIFSKSCPESIASEGSFGAYINKNLLPSQKIENCSQRKYFTPHWSIDAVNEALEKGDVFKALFRVNAHNRLEAYCKIDGIPIDILINGIAAQNRAVEGDIVVLKVDPLPLWTRMKGSAGYSNNISRPEDNVLLQEVNETAVNSCKGKSKIDEACEYTQCRNCLPLEKGFPTEENSLPGETACSQLIDSGRHSNDNGHHPHSSDSSYAGSFTDQSEAGKAVGRICALVSSFPSKRPTGRVVAIIERSSRRDVVIGFLGVKQLLSYKEACRKDAKNKNSFSFSEHEYIQLSPTDPKFPKMMVFVKGLPVPIRKRLEDGDVTVEMELVAAQIDNWSEETPIPQARILHVFGRGGELEPHINAILFENEISSSEFSADALSCLPSVPWEVPLEELKSRRDLRSLCTFTIDPFTASDLDDALSIEKMTNGIFRVGVHIADVSYFVLPDTSLDIEAQLRSTSVYMLQRKIPMLPPLLSESVGSLNPGVDRLAFSIFWDINSSGEVIDRWIGRSVIQSCCKFSYEHAQDIIDGKFDVEGYNSSGNNGCPQLHGRFEWPDVISSIKSLHKISKTLREKRFAQGALQLENCKLVFQLDEYGIPYDSMLCDRKDSNFLVEEFMLLANTTAAEIISRAFPNSALLRRHPEPNMRKLKDFEAFCYKHGLELDCSSSGRFHLSLKRIREELKDDSVLFNILISYATRPMQLASYFCSGSMTDCENDWGHYALAVPLYTHFTSPLRRYPDIIVHRTLAAAIEAEQLYSKHHQNPSDKVKKGEKVSRCYTGICFDKYAAESQERREVLSAAAIKHRIPCAELLDNVAAHCNERKLACRHVKDACEKLYMWVLLKKKEVFISEARVMGLGPKFMSIYIQELAIERRIYYDEVEGLTVEWLESTSTLVLSLCTNKRLIRRGSPGKCKVLEDVACIVSPCNLKDKLGTSKDGADDCVTNIGDIGKEALGVEPHSNIEIDPAVFPLTVCVLSTIPVALHAVGGDDGPLDIGVKLYMASYFK